MYYPSPSSCDTLCIPRCFCPSRLGILENFVLIFSHPPLVGVRCSIPNWVNETQAWNNGCFKTPYPGNFNEFPKKKTLFCMFTASSLFVPAQLHWGSDFLEASLTVCPQVHCLACSFCCCFIANQSAVGHLIHFVLFQKSWVLDYEWPASSFVFSQQEISTMSWEDNLTWRMGRKSFLFLF